MLAKINKALKQKCEEWEVPFECGDLSPLSGDAKSGDKSPHSKEAQKMVHQWWDLRRDRQKEIDASIARRAETEMLYDQPYAETKRARVSPSGKCSAGPLQNSTNTVA